MAFSIKKYSPFEEMFVKNIHWDSILEWSDTNSSFKKINSNLKLKKVKPIYSIDKKILLDNKINFSKKLQFLIYHHYQMNLNLNQTILLHYEHLTFKNVRGFWMIYIKLHSK